MDTATPRTASLEDAINSRDYSPWRRLAYDLERELIASAERVKVLEAALREIERGHDDTESFSGTRCAEIARQALGGAK